MHSMLLKDRKRVILVAAIIVIAALASLVLRALAPQPAPPVAEQPVAQSEKIPPLSPEITERLAKSNGFQTLVSYGDAGFWPATVTIKKGETIRFFNGTASGVHIVAAVSASGAPYPAESNACGQAFDSCQPVQHGDFWEFTFDKAGTWSYRDTANPVHAGTVIVR